MEKLYYYQGAYFVINLQHIKNKMIKQVESFYVVKNNKKIQQNAKTLFQKSFYYLDESYAKEVKYHSSCYKDNASLEKQLVENNDRIKTDPLKPYVQELGKKYDDKVSC